MERKRSCKIHVGTAGWSNPPSLQPSRLAGQSHLEHYAAHFSCVEINSCFYRAHRQATYVKWRQATPREFRFAVKMPRSITHESALKSTARDVDGFFRSVESLIPKLSVVLVQLPPSFEFRVGPVRAFFASLPRLDGVHIACEPRHGSWASQAADTLLAQLSVCRVAADPARFHNAERPGGARDFAYFRWHGSPQKYYSSYSTAQLDTLAAAVRAEHGESWCVFDNTARHAAWDNAYSLRKLLQGSS
jgi:uncharacterized protein YecE (DUF72 family)